MQVGGAEAFVLDLVGESNSLFSHELYGRTDFVGALPRVADGLQTAADLVKPAFGAASL